MVERRAGRGRGLDFVHSAGGARPGRGLPLQVVHRLIIVLKQLNFLIKVKFPNDMRSDMGPLN